VTEIFDETAAATMGFTEVDDIVIMIHTGSRGLGHQVATDYLKRCNAEMKEQNTPTVDAQLSFTKINGPLGQEYLSAMAAAANFAFVNRALITHQLQEAFRQLFGEEAQLKLVYDVCHNIAKMEDHTVINDDGTKEVKRLLVHRKGATRAFPPGHPEVPEKYQQCGQPVFVGGSMGTCSYILTGTAQSMDMSFGTTCHGAGRALPRSKCRKIIDGKELSQRLKDKGIYLRIKNEAEIADEAPEAYKNVDDVVETCEAAGLSKRTARVVPIAVIKG